MISGKDLFSFVPPKAVHAWNDNCPAMARNAWTKAFMGETLTAKEARVALTWRYGRKHPMVAGLKLVENLSESKKRPTTGRIVKMKFAGKIGETTKEGKK